MWFLYPKAEINWKGYTGLQLCILVWLIWKTGLSVIHQSGKGGEQERLV